ncbi:MAG: hypothetical protein IPL79_17690 [Myxococcales bacterium]|nr:hypothetical protein [Myxococcales bacterium]
MKKLHFACALALVAACSDTDDTTPPTPPPTGEEVVVEAGDITADTTWEAINTYRLAGQVFVTDGAVLTIEPGTKIVGDLGSVLVITADARIEAEGTATAPIVFTSSEPDMPAAGDWGGVVLLGRAPINVTGGTNKVEGFPDSVGSKITYGGSNAAHDCGTLKYVRVEFAGFELAPDNELNAITLGACGTGTTIQYVQTHRGLDDGIELFGGTVNLSHIVITQADDDAIDWDLGWNGTMQFLVIQQSAAIGDKGIEADSNKNNSEALPRSAPTLWNVTMIGGGAGGGQGGIHLRRGSALKLYNAIFMNFENFAINVDGSSTAALANAGDVTIENSYFVPVGGGEVWPTNFDQIEVDVNGNPVLTSDDCVSPNTSCFDESSFFSAVEFNNVLGEDPGLTDPTDAATPGFGTSASAPVLEGGATPPVGMDRSATYIGAVGTTNWLAGWTAYPAGN